MKKYTFFEISVIAVSWAGKGPRMRFHGFPHPRYRGVPADSFFLNREAYENDRPKLSRKHDRNLASAGILGVESFHFVARPAKSRLL
jgi:hypothetical protein